MSLNSPRRGRRLLCKPQESEPPPAVAAMAAAESAVAYYGRLPGRLTGCTENCRKPPHPPPETSRHPVRTTRLDSRAGVRALSYTMRCASVIKRIPEITRGTTKSHRSWLNSTWQYSNRQSAARHGGRARRTIPPSRCMVIKKRSPVYCGARLTGDSGDPK